MNVRSRYYAFLVYPESAPEDWKDILDSWHCQYLISPLHDSDTNPDGEIKKPHYHVLLVFDSLKSVAQFEDIRNSVGGVGREEVSSLRGYCRYLCHLDNPEKHRYSEDGVICGGGIDYFDIIGLPSDKYEMIAQMQDWCSENECFSYWELMRFARLNRNDWFRALCDNCSMVMSEFLKSYRWTALQSSDKYIDRCKKNLKNEKEKGD